MHAHPHAPDPGADWPQQAARWLGLLAALAAGLALVMAVASQWGQWSRPLRFGLLQGLLLLGLLLAWRQPRARPAWALLALIAQGALLAYFGQTYQTGADPWQLFALWALLGLPLVLAARHDATWVLWSLVASVAVALAVQTFGGHRWLPAPERAPVVWVGGLVLLALAGLLAPWAARWHGAGRWAWRAQALWAALLLAGWAVMLLWDDKTLGASMGLAALLAAAVVACWRGRDAVVLSLAVAALDAWLLALLGRLLFDGPRQGEPMAPMLLFALGAAGLLAGSVSLLMHHSRAAGDRA